VARSSAFASVKLSTMQLLAILATLAAAAASAARPVQFQVPTRNYIGFLSAPTQEVRGEPGAPSLSVLQAPEEPAADAEPKAGDNAGESKAEAGAGGEESKWSCGPVKSQKNARPKEFKDTRKTKYVKGEGKVDITYKPGDKIAFECLKGFTTDGAKGGNTDFEVTCSDLGYYTTEFVCVKESKCGKLPVIKNALATGEMKGDAAEFRCNEGFSLDGQKVVKGGFEKNARFNLKCTFQGVWEDFEGECKPVDFVSTADAISMYNQVFEVLFKVDCENELMRAKKHRDEFPSELESVCSKLEDKSGDCSGLVGEIKAEFDKEPDEFESKSFCTKMWNLLSFGEAKAASLFLVSLKKTVRKA